jgi:hypothetical protein
MIANPALVRGQFIFARARVKRWFKQYAAWQGMKSGHDGRRGPASVSAGYERKNRMTGAARAIESETVKIFAARRLVAARRAGWSLAR